jgi:hypothetical protein
MRKEREGQVFQQNEEFKNLVFANNLKLYDMMFSPTSPDVITDDEEELIKDDLVVPETAGDIAGLLADLKDIGLDLNNTTL